MVEGEGKERVRQRRERDESEGNVKRKWEGQRSRVVEGGDSCRVGIGDVGLEAKGKGVVGDRIGRVEGVLYGYGRGSGMGRSEEIATSPTWRRMRR